MSWQLVRQAVSIHDYIGKSSRNYFMPTTAMYYHSCSQDTPQYVDRIWSIAYSLQDSEIILLRKYLVQLGTVLSKTVNNFNKAFYDYHQKFQARVPWDYASKYPKLNEKKTMIQPLLDAIVLLSETWFANVFNLNSDIQTVQLPLPRTYDGPRVYYFRGLHYWNCIWWDMCNTSIRSESVTAISRVLYRHEMYGWSRWYQYQVTLYHSRVPVRTCL